MHRRFLQIFLILSVGFLSVSAVMGYRFFYGPMISHEPAVSIIIEPGSSLHNVTDELKTKGYLAHPSFLVLWAHLKGTASLIKAGEYQIPPGMTAPEFLSNVVSGKSILHEITIIEGWTFKDLLNALASNPFIEHSLSGLSDEAIMQKLGHPGQKTEGLFFPDTYFFTRGSKDLILLETAYKKMTEVLNFQWEQRAPNLPYHSAYQALIAASIVEKEAAIPGERSQVAGVIERRLQKGMRLQIDACVLYGLHQPMTYKLSKHDLQKVTPYNTYMNFALPPTPICLSSEESIYATLHPDAGNSLYYVARGDGSDEFSDTYQIHRKAVTRYIKTPQLKRGI